eukprot:5590899-Pyramimonas_sp.AAC.1
MGRPLTGGSWRRLSRPFTATTSMATRACAAPGYARGQGDGSAFATALTRTENRSDDILRRARIFAC